MMRLLQLSIVTLWILLSGCVSHHVETFRLSEQTKIQKLKHGSIQYELRGNGKRTLVFLNGFSIPYSMWEPQVRYFSEQGFRTLCFNYYGRGYSDYPSGVYSRKSFVESTIELLDSLHVTSATLIGHSFGASLASEIAASYPERIEQLIFVDPMLDKIKGVSGATIARTPLFGRVLTRMLVVGGIEKRAKLLLTEARQSDSCRSFLELQHQRKIHGYSRAVHQMFCGDALEDYRASYRHLDSLAIPTLILYGHAEAITPDSAMPTILSSLPSAEKTFYSSSGHLVHLTVPDSVNNRIDQFLQQKK